MYQPHRDASDPRVFFFYEQYTDEAAYQAHLASPHVKAIAKATRSRAWRPESASSTR